jgi:hypothetical protein
MKVGGKTQPQFAKSLDTSRDPVAMVTLTGPVTLNAGFASGTTVTERVTGRLAMHGISRPAVVTVSGRRDGSALQVAGSIPVTFSAGASGDRRASASSPRSPAAASRSSSSRCTAAEASCTRS